MIMTHTNEEIKSNQKSVDDETFTKIGYIEELEALLSHFIHGALKKDNHLSTTMLFTPSHCGRWYRSARSIKWLEFLVRLAFGLTTRYQGTMIMFELQTPNI
ncbi:hypothetical protein HHI36_006766 [Cryptolaemus montrouzieri]|uniref:Uncharacterized protein n=1 Tax=Cryptolaemus montrouzieri TaxID=559131 RepID=A0ABD2NY53_9CUCU